MMEYWDHWCSIWLKNNTVHGINKPWIEKTSTEDLEYLIYFLPIIPQFQHSTKIATDVWANQVLNALLDVPYHHLIMAIAWQLRIVIIMNRRAGLNLLVHAATESIQQWARDIKGMGILIFT